MAIGRGVSMSTAIIGGALGLATIAGLAVGLGIEGSKSSVRTRELDDLKSQIQTVEDITKDINVRPPNGFIN